MQERFIDREGRGEHRRERHGWTGRVGDAVGVSRDNAATPAGENRPHAEAGLLAFTAVPNMYPRRACRRRAKTATKRDDGLSKGCSKRQRR